jgi:DEAD/DEAH box helicase domain-containing protein
MQHLTKLDESYLGGYSMSGRRKVEERLFRNELLAVVGTNALELSVDVGGIDLTPQLWLSHPRSRACCNRRAGSDGAAIV